MDTQSVDAKRRLAYLPSPPERSKTGPNWPIIRNSVGIPQHLSEIIMKLHIKKLMSVAASLVVLATTAVTGAQAKSHQFTPDPKAQSIANHLKAQVGGASSQIFGRRAPRGVYVQPFTIDPLLTGTVFASSLRKDNRTAIYNYNQGTAFAAPGVTYQGIQGVNLTSFSYDLSADSDVTNDTVILLLGTDLGGNLYIHFCLQDFWDLSGPSGGGWTTYFYFANDAFFPAYPAVAGEVISDMVLVNDGFFQTDNVWLSNFQINGFRLHQQMSTLQL